MSLFTKRPLAALVAAACFTIFAPHAVAEVVLDDVSWQTVGADVEFSMVFRNDDPINPSQEFSGELSSQPFGAYVDNIGLICGFDIPPIPPESFFDVVCTVPFSSLPPSADRILPNPPPGPGARTDLCPPDSFWAGNVDVFWFPPPGPPVMVNAHFGTLQVRPGAGPSYIHVIMDCQDPAGVTWSFSGVCAGWTATLVVDAGGTPGGPAPNPLPPGFFDGWICVSADASKPIGSTCHFDLDLICGPVPGGVPAKIQMWTEACNWDKPVSVDSNSWGRVKGLYR